MERNEKKRGRRGEGKMKSIRDEPLFTQRDAKWSDVSDCFWHEMCKRMLALPQDNFAFWDNAELNILQMFVQRFFEMQHLYSGNKNYQDNWRNATIATEFAEGLYSQYEPYPNKQFLVPPLRQPRSLATEEKAEETLAGYYDKDCAWCVATAQPPEEIPLKQMIRSGDVIEMNKSFIDECPGALEFSIETLQKLNTLKRVRSSPSEVVMDFKVYKCLRDDLLVGEGIYTARYDLKFTLSEEE